VNNCLHQNIALPTEEELISELEREVLLYWEKKNK
jgi:hypothetical protein